MTDLTLETSHVDRTIIQGLPQGDQLANFFYVHAAHCLAPQLNVVVELLDKAVDKGFADRPLLRSPQLTLTYAQTRERVNQMGHVLVEDLGLVPGQCVLLRGGNSIELVLAWLAVVKAGCIAVATMPLLRAVELGAIIDKARPTVALCDVALLGELEQAQTTHACLQTIVSLNAPQDPHGLMLRSTGKSKQWRGVATNAGDPALMAFTSGTTGQPKAVVHTHRDVLAACEAWPRFVLKATPDDMVFGSPPLAFTFGLGGLLIFPMWAGASVYFHDAPLTPQTVLDVMNREKITISYTAPTMYRQLAPLAKAQGGIASLRLSVSAGEALPDATRTLWREATGIEMLDGIGATEMFHIFISSPPHEVRAGAIGKAVPGYEARVLDDEGQELPIGQVGKLAVRGPTGCRYYADERQANYVKNGWNYPGDTFYQDADGYFYYVARADDMIITAGYNVGAPEVESALLKHPAVAECAVVGDADLKRGMVIHAHCVLHPGFVGDEAMVKQLQDHVKGTIAPFKYPRRVSFKTSLPRTETGKLQRFKLKGT